MKQPETNSNPGQRLNGHDFSRIFLAGLVLLLFHSLGTVFFASLGVYPTMIVGFIFCGADLLIALSAASLTSWDEPNSFKIANIASGSTFLTILVFILAWAIGIFVLDAIGDGYGRDVWFDVVTVMISFVPAPLLLAVISIIWSVVDDQRSNRLGPRATQGVKLSLIALGAGVGIMIPLCQISIFALGG